MFPCVFTQSSVDIYRDKRKHSSMYSIFSLCRGASTRSHPPHRLHRRHLIQHHQLLRHAPVSHPVLRCLAVSSSRMAACRVTSAKIIDVADHTKTAHAVTVASKGTSLLYDKVSLHQSFTTVETFKIF